MTYEEAYTYINETNKVGSILGLDSIRELLNRLDNPQDHLQVVHVAGTNGKGSVCTFLNAILEDAGYTIGRYISPTLVTYLERFQINGRNMLETEFAELLQCVKQAADDMVEAGYPRPTSFETETAVAFLFFMQKKVDIVLLETGMGGRLDATNVVKHPLCTVLTSISMDHMQFLGNDLPSILQEKMGIMRENVPCVSYTMEECLKDIWVDKCEKMNCPYKMIEFESINVIEKSLEGTKFSYCGEQYELGIAGEYQIYNSLVAVETAKILNKYSNGLIDLKYVNIYNGLKKAKWAGRFQKIGDHPPIYIDGAHNEGGWQSLCDNIYSYFQDNQIVYLCGVLADKEYDKMIKLLSPYSDEMVVITPDNSRGLPKEQLKRVAEGSIEHIYLAETVLKGKEEAIEIAKQYPNPVVLVFGSLSFLGPLIEPSL